MTLALAACKRGAADILLSGQTMGTSYTVVAVEPRGGLDEDGLKTAIDAVLADIDQKMSNWNPASEISQINDLKADTPFTLSPDMVSLMQSANDVHQASDGQFDLTLGPLIDLWGFGAQKPTGRIPNEPDVAAAMHSVGQSGVLSMDSGILTKTHDGTQMYLSAIGKGFGVDRLGDTVRSFGVTDFMVEIGGDIITSGQNAEGMPWQIAIETPDARQRSFLKVLGVSDLGMATSGDYRNYFEKDRIRYSHIIDAQTGRPVTHPTASVTVLTQNTMLADAWATALLVLGNDRKTR
jgi:thiamine biosynthesis lipoprotein